MLVCYWSLLFYWPLAAQNQFFISGLSEDETIRNRVLEALYSRIRRADKEKKCFRVIIVIPLLPGFQVLFFSIFPCSWIPKINFWCLDSTGWSWWWWSCFCESSNALAVSYDLQRAQFNIAETLWPSWT